MSATELTSEEIVTKLLTSNEIVKQKQSYMSDTEGTLGKFLSAIPEPTVKPNKGKYTFIELI